MNKLTSNDSLSSKLLIVVLSSILLLTTMNCSYNTNAATLEIPQNSLDSIFKHFQIPNPGLSCMVIKNKKIVLKKNFGFADVENKTRATSKTNYRIASMSKQFTATAIMKLVHQGKLTYETTLSEIFKGFPEYGDNITIRHLLTHRSGILGYDNFVIKGEQILDERILEELMKINSIRFYPNEKFMYSNSGYAVLAQVVEKISEQPFAEYMKNEIFGPSNMLETNLYEANKKITNRAFGYTIENDSIKKTDHNETSAVKGDGSIYTSLLDLYNWDQVLYTDMLMPNEFLNEAYYNYDTDGRSNEKGYGYGWMVNYSDSIKILEHTGASIGFTHHIIRVPSLELSVIVLTNRNHNYYSNLNFNNIGYSLINSFSENKLNLQ
ncbi:MAG: serine hydrolase domain-containing protein [Saprospiraceae bacterium]